MKKPLIITLVALLCVVCVGAEEAVSLTPKFHGALRARWELDTESGSQRFQVRNARVIMEGNVTPWAQYFVQTDLSDCGQMKILDAFGQLSPLSGLSFRMGQFRMPFGVETFRAPQNYIFNNRSFMGKQVMNYRAVGARVAYKIPRTPVNLEAGVFNPGSITQQTQWNRTVAAAAKATVAIGPEVSFSGSFATLKPSTLRSNLVDASLVWAEGSGHWTVAAEYMLKDYCGSEFKATHSWLAFADWGKAVSWGGFNRWSIQARYDGMTRNVNLATLATDSARNRITVGSTLSCLYKIAHIDLRLNYEKMFRRNQPGDPDLLSAELVIRF